MTIPGLARLFLLSVVSLYGAQGQGIHIICILFRTIDCMCWSMHRSTIVLLVFFCAGARVKQRAEEKGPLLLLSDALTSTFGLIKGPGVNVGSSCGAIYITLPANISLSADRPSCYRMLTHPTTKISAGWLARISLYHRGVCIARLINVCTRCACVVMEM